MKKIFAALLLALSVSTAHAQYENTTINVGQKAPELAFPTPNGKQLKLSEVYKGRVVLLDFWASWCGPCRRSSPALVSTYKEYKDRKFKGAKKGFTVVSVSLDQKKEPWLKAIETDSLTWPYHMSDLGGWQSKAAVIYGVQFIPQSFLVGPDGKVIGKYTSIEQADEDLKKLVIAQ